MIQAFLLPYRSFHYRQIAKCQIADSPHNVFGLWLGDANENWSWSDSIWYEDITNRLRIIYRFQANTYKHGGDEKF
jgi:hypothetical protein